MEEKIILNTNGDHKFTKTIYKDEVNFISKVKFEYSTQDVVYVRITLDDHIKVEYLRHGKFVEFTKDEMLTISFKKGHWTKKLIKDEWANISLYGSNFDLDNGGNLRVELNIKFDDVLTYSGWYWFIGEPMMGAYRYDIRDFDFVKAFIMEGYQRKFFDYESLYLLHNDYPSKQVSYVISHDGRSYKFMNNTKEILYYVS